MTSHTKPREASFTASLIDDAAARNNTSKLWQRAVDWRYRAHNGTDTTLARLWELASDAAEARAHAVEHRLAGNIVTALTYERLSDEALTRMAGGRS